MCVPQEAMNRDEAHYPSADVFDAFRFVGGSKLTDAKYPWTMWGIPRAIWYVDSPHLFLESPRFLIFNHLSSPGRFYTASVLKVLVSYILNNFDVKIEDTRRKREFTWRTAIVSLVGMMINFKQRDYI